MTTLPASGYFTNPARTNAEGKTGWNDQLDVTREQPGGSAEQSLTIASGSITPAAGASRSIVVDTETGGATDELDSIVLTNIPDGADIWLRSLDASKVTEVTHNIGASGKFSLRDGQSFFLDDPAKQLHLRRVGTVCVEIGRSHHLLKLEAEQATTSGTSIDRTGVSPNAKRATILFNGVSTNGTSPFLVQIGDSGGIGNTGYDGTSSRLELSAVVTNGETTGFRINTNDTATNLTGRLVISLENSANNTWVAGGTLSSLSTNDSFTTAGSKSLSGVLDRIRLTTVNGTDTFDAGAINIIVE